MDPRRKRIFVLQYRHKRNEMICPGRLIEVGFQSILLCNFQHLVRVERELVLVFQLFVFIFPAVKVGFDVAELFARGEEPRPVRSWFWFEENQVDGFIRDGEFMRDLVGKDGVVKFQFDGVRLLFTSSFARERRTEALAVDDRGRRGGLSARRLSKTLLLLL